MPVWLSFFFVLPILIFPYKRNWLVSISIIALFLVSIMNEDWNKLPQASEPITITPTEIIISIIILNTSIESRWVDMQSAITSLIMCGAFILGVLLYYLISSYLFALNGYIMAPVALFLFSGLPVLCGWVQNYFKR